MNRAEKLKLKPEEFCCSFVLMTGVGHKQCEIKLLNSHNRIMVANYQASFKIGCSF